MGDVRRVRLQTGDVIAALCGDRIVDFTGGREHHDRAHAGPDGRPLPACEDVAGNAPACLDTSVILLDFTVLTDEYFPISQRNTLNGLERGADMRKQRLLVAFYRQDIVGPGLYDARGDSALATHRIDGDDRALEQQSVEEFRMSSCIVASSKRAE